MFIYMPTLVIRSINLNTYYIQHLNSLMILLFDKEVVDHLDMISIVNNFIKNGNVKL